MKSPQTTFWHSSYQLLLFLPLLLAGQIWAQTDPSVRQRHFLVRNGAALQGYDAVSYSTGKPIKGQAAYSYVYQGINYQFASAANLAAFKAAPQQYEPAFGGWCAYAIGKDGSKVVPNPLNYKIVEGKVYLFYDDWITDTKKEWNKNESSLNQRAKSSWSSLISR